MDFNHENAFSRNIGWLTKEELKKVKSIKIAIAGLGGAGGEHAITLARMGFENFHLSDFDEFEEHNFNRQAGAFVSTIGKSKCEVISKMLLDINPNANIQLFQEGVNKGNIDAFFQDVDIYVDGIDFFAMDARMLIYKAAMEKEIPNFSAAPLGMGCSFVCFTKDSMSFEDYYRFEESKNDEERLLKFLIGLSPAMMHKSYLVDKMSVNFSEKRGPSTPMAIKICAGILVTEVVKFVLNRGKITTAPYALQIDAYKGKLKKSWSPMGTNGPIQRLKLAIIKRILAKMNK